MRLVLALLAAFAVGLLVVRFGSRATEPEDSATSPAVEPTAHERLSTELEGATQLLDAPGPREALAAAAPRERPSRTRPMLVGRVVDEHGVPVPDTFFAGGLTRDGASLSGMPVETDREGRFAWDFSGSLEPPWRGLELVFQMRTDGVITHRGRVRLPPLADDEVLELGDVPLEPWSGSVRVWLVDRSGAPVVDRETRVLLLDREGEQVDREDAAHEPVVLDVRGVELVRFALESDTWHLVGPEVTAAGGDDVRLTVARGGGIVGRLLLPEGFPRHRLSVRASAMHSEDRGRYGEFAKLGDAVATAFQVSGLAEGRFRLEVVCDEASLATVDDLPVAFDRTTLDPRLDPLDLREQVSLARVQVFEAGGLPVPSALVWVEGRTGFGHVQADEHGVAMIGVSRSRPATLLVQGPGHVPRTVEGVVGDVEVWLEQGIELRLQASRPAELDIGSHGAWLVLRRDEPLEATRWLHDVELGWSFGDGEPHDVVLPGSGTYRLHICVLRRFGTSFGLTEQDSFVPTDSVLVVRPSDRGRILTVALPVDLFAAGLR